MTTAPAPNRRASLLAGLRTGGVRSASASVPHTAAPGGSFNVPRFASHSQHQSFFPEEEEDELAEMPAQNMYANPNHGAANRAVPMTAAVDGPSNRFSLQQGRGMNPNSVPFSPAFTPNMLAQPNHVQTQALQMQMMQLEIMRIQASLSAVQAQQYQAEIIAQAQRQQQQQQQQQQQSQNRRASLGFNPPATAGPLTNSFDLRSATLSAQMRRATQAEQLKSQLGLNSEEQVPMTAALGGKFGSRTTSLSGSALPSRFAAEDNDDMIPPPTPSSTTVISGGTSLGNPASNNISASNNAANSTVNGTPSKSDSAVSWRRGGNNNSVLSGNNRAVTSPSVKVTPPPGENQRVSPPPIVTPIRTRPQPLRFSVIASQPLPATVAIDADAMDNDNDDASSTSSSKSGASNSSPTTPRSSSSNEMPLSPREEASKKLYEGLGIGRPAPSPAVQHEQLQQIPSVVSHRMVSQPMRQPRGPPSGADELGPKNFATRIRRKAIGGLGMLMGARERREFIEAY